jgi:hypothetical protein
MGAALADGIALGKRLRIGMPVMTREFESVFDLSGDVLVLCCLCP